MSLLPGRKMGTRTLRLGSKGKDVQQLQAFLRLQGHDLGEEDYYGYLTKYAVQQFQKEHGLVADGIAGKRLFALALSADLPIRRRIHVVQPQETIDEIAQMYGIGPQAFVQTKRLHKIFAGQRLLFFDREIWGMCPSDGLLSSLPQGLTGLVCPPPLPTGLVGPCVALPELGNSDPVFIHGLLRTARRRKATANTLLESMGGSCGLYLSWSEVAPLNGARYLKLIKKVRRRLPKQSMLWVELGPGVPPRSIWGGVNYEEINELASRVVLSVPVPQTPGPLLNPGQVEHLLTILCPRIHSWKVLLRVPVYALEWKVADDTSEYLKLPYKTALSRAFRHGARLEKDGEGGLYYRYQSRGSQFQLRLPQLNTLGEVLALTNRHNLAGVILDRLGMEDPRLWNIVSNYFHFATL
jgi:peptidoglycan hydrolase-like protein with peptidoglycan-binding domain